MTNPVPSTTQPDTDDTTITEVEPGVFVRKSKNSKYIIEYHREICIGAGSCAQIAPATFEMDDENKAVFVQKEGENEDVDDVILAAAQSCPVFAIIVKDAETGEQLFPLP